MTTKNKNMTLGEILKHPEHPLMQDVLHNEEASWGDKLKCIRCKKNYKRGFWDFYSLCGKCFALFDKQKMLHRFEHKKGYESAMEWVESETKHNNRTTRQQKKALDLEKKAL